MADEFDHGSYTAGDNLNPYSPPRHNVGDSDSIIARRHQAQSGLRLAMLILAGPAIYNYYCFDSFAFGPLISAGHSTWPPYASPMAMFRFINICGIAATGLFIWFMGIQTLEWISGAFHRFLGRNSTRSQWIDALYKILRPAVWLASIGSVLWLLWTVGFYKLGLGFYEISVPVGIGFHLLAATIYLRLVVRWFRIERIASRTLGS